MPPKITREEFLRQKAERDGRALEAAAEIEKEAAAKASALVALRDEKQQKQTHTQEVEHADRGMVLRDGLIVHDTGPADHGMELRDGLHLHEPHKAAPHAKRHSSSSSSSAHNSSSSAPDVSVSLSAIPQPLSGLPANIFAMPPAPASFFNASDNQTHSEKATKEVMERHAILEKQHNELKEKHEEANAKVVQLQASMDELDNLKEQAMTAQRLVHDKDLELSSKNRLMKELQHSKEDAQDRYRRQAEESDRLRDELTAQAKEVAQLQTSMHAKQVALTESEAKSVHLQIELSKAQRERGFQDNTIQTLERDLKARSDEYSRARLEHSSMKMELETSNSNLKAQLEELKTQHSTLKVNSASHQNTSDKGSVRIREVEATMADMERSFVQEVEEKKKLVELLKRHLEEAGAKLEFSEKKSETERATSEQIVVSLKEQVLQAEVSAKELKAVQTQSEQEISDLKLQLETETTKVAASAANQTSVVEAAATLQVEGLSTTEMYSRVVNTERSLATEQSKRKEAELYLNRILKDLETKAPLLARQKQDFNRVLEQNQLLSDKLEVTQEQNSQLQQDVDSLSTQGREINSENAAVSASNRDLSAQLQFLLKQKIEEQHERPRAQRQRISEHVVATIEDVEGNINSINSAVSTVPEHFLLFNDVPELQTRNEQLVRVVRKLEADHAHLVQNMRDQGFGPDGEMCGKNLETLHLALNELKDMKDARSRTEDMVLGLVQQRNMYKTMLDDAGVQRSDAGATPMKNPEMTLTAPTSRQKDSSWKLAQTEEENSQLRERLDKYRELEKTLNESLEETKATNGTLRLEVAQLTGEVRFHGERAERLEDTFKSAQVESESAQQRTFSLDARVLELQTEMRKKEQMILTANEQLHTAHDSTRKAEIEAVACKETEKRLESLLDSEKEESKRQASLADSIRRIETSLSQRLEEEKATLQLERDSLSRNLESLRKQLSDRSATSDQRIRVLESDVSDLRLKEEDMVREAATLRETAVREEGSAKAARERAVMLEKQLSTAQDKLSAIQGAQTMDAVLVRENEQKTLALDTATSEVVRLTSELSTATEHMDNFRQVSASTEKTLAELQQRNANNEVARATEVAKLKQSVETDRAEITQLRANNLSILAAIEGSRDEANQAKRDLVESTRVHAMELAEAKQTARAASAHEGQLRADIHRFQQLARADKENYAREQELHTLTQKERRALESQLDENAEYLQMARNSQQDALKEKEMAQQALESKKMEAAALRLEADMRVEAATSTRENLLQEFNSLTTKLAEAEARSLESGSSAGTGGGEGVDASEGEKELANSRKSVAHLTAVVRGMKTEEEIIRSRLSVAETEMSRQQVELRVSQKALEEARAHLKRDEEERSRTPHSSTPVKGGQMTAEGGTSGEDDELARLKSQVSQLKMATESNMYLQKENEALSKRLKGKDTELKSAGSKLLPLEQSIRNLEADKVALTADKNQSTDDSKFWKDKYTKYLSDQGKGLDEDAFRDLQEQIEKLGKQCEELRADLAESVAEAAEATKAVHASRAETKIALEQGSATSLSSEGLKEGLLKQVQELQVNLDTKVQELSHQMLSNQNIEKTSEKRYAMLKAMKEKFQKEKSEWMEKYSKQEKELQDARTGQPAAVAQGAPTGTVAGSGTVAGTVVPTPAAAEAPKQQQQPAAKLNKQERKRTERAAKIAESKAAAALAATQANASATSASANTTAVGAVVTDAVAGTKVSVSEVKADKTESASTSAAASAFPRKRNATEMETTSEAVGAEATSAESTSIKPAESALAPATAKGAQEQETGVGKTSQSASIFTSAMTSASGQQTVAGTDATTTSGTSGSAASVALSRKKLSNPFAIPSTASEGGLAGQTVSGVPAPAPTFSFLAHTQASVFANSKVDTQTSSLLLSQTPVQTLAQPPAQTPAQTTAQNDDDVPMAKKKKAADEQDQVQEQEQEIEIEMDDAIVEEHPSEAVPLKAAPVEAASASVNPIDMEQAGANADADVMDALLESQTQTQVAVSAEVVIEAESEVVEVAMAVEPVDTPIAVEVEVPGEGVLDAPEAPVAGVTGVTTSLVTSTDGTDGSDIIEADFTVFTDADAAMAVIAEEVEGEGDGEVDLDADAHGVEETESDQVDLDQNQIEEIAMEEVAAEPTIEVEVEEMVIPLQQEAQEAVLAVDVVPTEAEAEEAPVAAAMAVQEEDPAAQLKKMKEELRMRQQLKGWKNKQNKEKEKEKEQSGSGINKTSADALSLSADAEDSEKKRQRVEVEGGQVEGGHIQADLSDETPPVAATKTVHTPAASTSAPVASTGAASTTSTAGNGGSIFGSFSSSSPFSTAGGKFSAPVGGGTPGDSSVKPFTFNVGAKLFNPSPTTDKSASTAASASAAPSTISTSAESAEKAAKAAATAALAQARLSNSFAKPTGSTSTISAISTSPGGITGQDSKVGKGKDKDVVEDSSNPIIGGPLPLLKASSSGSMGSLGSIWGNNINNANNEPLPSPSSTSSATKPLFGSLFNSAPSSDANATGTGTGTKTGTGELPRTPSFASGASSGASPFGFGTSTSATATGAARSPFAGGTSANAPATSMSTSTFASVGSVPKSNPFMSVKSPASTPASTEKVAAAVDMKESEVKEEPLKKKELTLEEKKAIRAARFAKP